MARVTVDSIGDERDRRRQVIALTDDLLRDYADGPRQDFYGAQFDMGLAFVHFPVGNGGLGLSPKLQLVINRRITDAGVPLVRGSIGHGMGAPTIVVHGTEEQKERFLRRCSPTMRCGPTLLRARGGV